MTDRPCASPGCEQAATHWAVLQDSDVFYFCTFHAHRLRDGDRAAGTITPIGSIGTLVDVPALYGYKGDAWKVR